MGAKQEIQRTGALPVPLKLRNASTKLMKQEGYGKDYVYAHEREGHHVAGETYLPDELEGARFYEPGDQGLEKAIGERLRWLRRGRGEGGGEAT